MKKLILSFLALSVMLFSVNEASAQLRTPAASPGSTLQATVGLTDITIEYSRPGVKGRTVFAADGLVPFGEIWRLGANSATKFTFSEDVMVGGQKVEKGSYAVLAVPNAKEWKFMMYPYESSSFGSYVEKDPAVSFTVESSTWDINVESMTFMIMNVQTNSADIMFFWEKTGVTIPVQVYTDRQVSEQFKKMQAGPSDGEYFAMGSYMHDQGNDLETALKYVQKVTGKDDARYWQVRREALILGDMGKYADAIKSAEKSLKAAEAAGNMDYVRMNKASIEEWSKMMKEGAAPKKMDNMQKSKG